MALTTTIKSIQDIMRKDVGVDGELMTLCDALESKLTAAQTTGQRLLDASVAQMIA